MLIFVSFFLAAALTGLDQALKALVVARVQPAGGIDAIPGLLRWQYSENTGAAFGILQDRRWVFLIVTAVLLALCVYALVRHYRRSVYGCFVLALILAGGLGNMIDRVRLGYVVDYIYLSFFPAIFNFADCCVVAGAILAVIGFLVAERRAAKTKSSAGEAAHE